MPKKLEKKTKYEIEREMLFKKASCELDKNLDIIVRMALQKTYSKLSGQEINQLINKGINPFIFDIFEEE